jgi:hypothetical protein
MLGDMKDHRCMSQIQGIGPLSEALSRHMGDKEDETKAQKIIHVLGPLSESILLG